MSEEIKSNLISCPDCGREISAKAATCPQCGCPIAQKKITVEVPDTRVEVQTVERTSKRWKGQMVAGCLLMFVAIFIIVAPIVAGDLSRANPVVGGGFFLIGLIVWLGAKVSAWWNHG